MELLLLLQYRQLLPAVAPAAAPNKELMCDNCDAHGAAGATECCSRAVHANREQSCMLAVTPADGSIGNADMVVQNKQEKRSQSQQSLIRIGCC